MNEEQKVQELLKPRYLLTADFPGCSFEVGTILVPNEEGELYSKQAGYSWTVSRVLEKDVKKFKHLFRKLEWWEERNASEMPEYVKNDKEVYKAKWVEGAITENGKQPMRLETDSHDLQVIKNVMCFFEPATSAEYAAYIEKQPTTQK